MKDRYWQVTTSCFSAIVLLCVFAHIEEKLNKKKAMDKNSVEDLQTAPYVKKAISIIHQKEPDANLKTLDDMVSYLREVDKRYEMFQESLTPLYFRDKNFDFKTAEQKGINFDAEVQPFPHVTLISALENNARKIFPKYNKMPEHAKVLVLQTLLLTDDMEKDCPNLTQALKYNTATGYKIAEKECALKNYPELTLIRKDFLQKSVLEMQKRKEKGMKNIFFALQEKTRE